VDASDIDAAVVAAKEVEGVGFLSNGAMEAVGGNLGASRGFEFYISGIRIGGGWSCAVGGGRRGRGLEQRPPVVMVMMVGTSDEAK
jgi:hypothetical protein